ncbi:MAG TPA: MFS transporter [Anaeromyxobacteraceae bacterium]|nr:MFS transporter [Anaeromyxobacteraceae bacterium]
MATGWLERLGLHRPELRAWALYDWANSVFMTTVVQVFPLFFVSYAASGLPPAVARSRFAIATSLAVVLIGMAGPFLGAVADVRAAKKRLLAAFLVLGVAATAAMALVREGEWVLAAALFVLGNVGITATLAFYNALLPSIAAPEEVDRVSTAGFALGYLGGGLLLALDLAAIQSPAWFGLPDRPAATRAAFLSAAAWWALFSLPLLRRVPEPAARLEPGEAGAGAARAALRRLGRTLRELRRHPDAAWLLLAFVVYNDAINTIIRMATAFGDELGIPQPSLIAAILMVQLVGVPFAFAFGMLAGRIGPKRAILLALAVYAAITVFGFRMRTADDFFLLAFLVATVQGGSQALSRSLFATLVPRHKAGEMFGIYAVFDRFGGAMGSLLFGLVLAATGSSRPAILALIVFFALGALLLGRVDVRRGREAAREAEARAGGVAPGGRG